MSGFGCTALELWIGSERAVSSFTCPSAVWLPLSKVKPLSFSVFLPESLSYVKKTAIFHTSAEGSIECRCLLQESSSGRTLVILTSSPVAVQN